MPKSINDKFWKCDQIKQKILKQNMYVNYTIHRRQWCQYYNRCMYIILSIQIKIVLLVI